MYYAIKAVVLERDFVKSRPSLIGVFRATYPASAQPDMMHLKDLTPRSGSENMQLSPEQDLEIAAVRAQVHETSRPTVLMLEAILHQPIPVLDHGFIRVIDYMGDDSSVVQAARVSYGRGTRRVSEDRTLIRYLMSHWHSTPFEMAEIKLHVKLPIFVARQWIRHRMASVNEYSARYSILDREFYLPASEHMAAQSTTNRQGRGSVLGPDEAARVLDLLRTDAERNYDHYVWMLNEGAEGAPSDEGRIGLARELARMNLTLNSYTQWYWKSDLHNLFGFLRLRADAHAQYEIRAYADEILKVVEAWVPLSYEAFRDYRMEAVSLSKQALAVVRRMVAGERVAQEGSGMSKREWEALDVLLSGLPTR